MLFYQLFDRSTCTFTYLIADKKTREAILIDPVYEHFDRDKQLLHELDLCLVYTAETHIHADHVTSGGLFRKALSSKSITASGAGADCSDLHVGHLDLIRVGNLTLEVRRTPGHTSGCISYILNHDQNKNLALTKLNYSIQLATMNSSGIWQCRKGEGEAKQYALANASRSGITAAFLAQKNSKTPIDMIEGELGFLKAFTNKINFEALIKKENTHLINEVSNKPWPACRHSHPVIGVALELKKIIKKEKINIEDIKFIEIETYQTAIDFCNKPNPTNEIEGKFSLQHCCAISLIFEDIKESFFEKSILNNNEIVGLRKKIRVNSNKQMSINFPKNYSVQIKIKFNNDKELTQKSNHAKGDPENPMSEKEICNKTLDLVNSHIKNNNFNNLIEKILNTNIENDKSSIMWFNDLQQIINGKGY